MQTYKNISIRKDEDGTLHPQHIFLTLQAAQDFALELVGSGKSPVELRYWHGRMVTAFIFQRVVRSKARGKSGVTDKSHQI